MGCEGLGSFWVGSFSTQKNRSGATSRWLVEPVCVKPPAVWRDKLRSPVPNKAA